MGFITVFLFFVYTFCLGFLVTSFVKNSDNFLERNLMRLGFGLAMLPFLGLILNLISIPIDWRIVLALSLAYPIYYAIKNRQKPSPSFKITKANISIIIMLAIFFANLYVYASGAFNYPYLEDDDSWSHAIGVKYVSVEKTVFEKTSVGFHYIDPYPPTYDLLLGIMHQTNNSVYWTLKFFNALIVSLSTIFFYFFVKEFTQDRNKALFASFALASVPAFMSHFIWSISLTVPLYFVAFYALERIKHDKKWWIVAGLVIVTTLTSSPTHSTYFGLFFILYLLTKAVLQRGRIFYHTLAGALGAALSFVFWWLPMLLKHGFKGTIEGLGFSFQAVKEAGSAAFMGTGDRIYSFSDFFIAQKQNMVNNPIGIGIFLSALVIAALIFLLLKFRRLPDKENHWIVITLVWLIFTLYAVNAARFPIKLSPFRTWMLLAIPVCILASEGAFNLMGMAKKLWNPAKYLLLIVLLAGIYFTSAQQKIAVNTAQWPPGAFWTSNDEIVGYLWLKENLPAGAKVFTFANNAPIIGFDKFTCHWCEDVNDFQKNGFDKNADAVYDWLKSKNYEYVTIDGQTSRKFGLNETNNKVQELINSNKFKPIFGNNGVVMFEVI